VGLLNLPQIYFLYMDLWHSSWLLEGKCECGPMFLSFFIPVGVFLLMAARRPSEHRSMIALVAWWNISHGAGDGYSNRGSVDSRRPPELCRCDRNPCDRSCPVSASASKTRGSRAGSCVNERRNPTLYADNRFFFTRWPPSAAQTVRADFRHTAFTRTPANGSENQAKGLER
jgi:hypothetical protein